MASLLRIFVISLLLSIVPEVQAHKIYPSLQTKTVLIYSTPPCTKRMVPTYNDIHEAKATYYNLGLDTSFKTIFFIVNADTSFDNMFLNTDLMNPYILGITYFKDGKKVQLSAVKTPFFSGKDLYRSIVIHEIGHEALAYNDKQGILTKRFHEGFCRLIENNSVNVITPNPRVDPELLISWLCIDGDVSAEDYELGSEALQQLSGNRPEFFRHLFNYIQAGETLHDALLDSYNQR